MHKVRREPEAELLDGVHRFVPHAYRQDATMIRYWRYRLFGFDRRRKQDPKRGDARR